MTAPRSGDSGPRRIGAWVARRQTPAMTLAMFGIGAAAAQTHNWWLIVVAVVVGLAEDFDNGWRRSRDRDS